jgi:hypothetical protein
MDKIKQSFVKANTQDGHDAFVRIADIQIVEFKNTDIIIFANNIEYYLGNINRGIYKNFKLHDLTVFLGINILGY